MQNNKYIIDNDILSPMLDVTFKSLLTRNCKESKIVLIDLISSIINRNVVDVTVINNEPTARNIQQIHERLDVNCKLSTGELLNL